jgi:hypothetical protein
METFTIRPNRQRLATDYNNIKTRRDSTFRTKKKGEIRKIICALK